MNITTNDSTISARIDTIERLLEQGMAALSTMLDGEPWDGDGRPLDALEVSVCEARQEAARLRSIV